MGGRPQWECDRGGQKRSTHRMARQGHRPLVGKRLGWSDADGRREAHDQQVRGIQEGTDHHAAAEELPDDRFEFQHQGLHDEKSWQES